MYQIVKIENGVKKSLGYYPSLRDAHIEMKKIREKERKNGYHINKTEKTEKGLITAIYFAKRHKITRKVTSSITYKVYKLHDIDFIDDFYSNDTLFSECNPEKRKSKIGLYLSDNEYAKLQELSRKYNIPISHIIRLALKELIENKLR